MNKLFHFLIIIALWTSAASAQTKTFTTAIEYNDYLVSQQFLIDDEIKNYNLAIDQGASDEVIWSKFNTMVAVTEKIYNELDNIVPFHQGEKLHLSFKSLIGFYLTTFKTDYKRITEIILKTEITIEEQTEIQTILAKITDAETVYDDAFLKAQEAFASFYGFELEPAAE